MKSLIVEIIIVVALLAIVVALVVFVAAKNQDTQPTPNVEEKAAGDMGDVPTTGVLYFSTEMPGDEKEDPVPTILTARLAPQGADIKRHQITSWFDSRTDAEATAISFSPNGSWATFLAWNKFLEEDGDGAFAVQVYRSRVGDDDLGGLLTRAEQMTDVLAAWKRLPVISNEGAVLYTSRGTNVSQSDVALSATPSDWTIHYIQNDGTKREVAYGRYPHWLDSSGFIYIADAGLTYHNVVTDQEVLLVGVADLPAHFPDITFDIANDGAWLVLSSMADDTTQVYQVSQVTAGEVVLTLTNTFDDAGGQWPVVSPDDTSFGLMRFDPMPQYVFFNLSDGSMNSALPTINLTAYDINHLWITDWR